MHPDKIYLLVDGRRVSLSNLMEMDRDAVSTVYASGCTGLTALPDLPNAEHVDASGCTGLTKPIFDGGENPRGWWVRDMYLGSAWRVIAGCRNLTIDGARAHWGRGERAHPGCLAVAEAVISQIEAYESGAAS
jgi:hypothetical protein